MRTGFVVCMFVVYVVCIWGDNTAQAAGLVSGGQASILYQMLHPTIVGDWGNPLSVISAVLIVPWTYIKITWNILTFNFSFFNMNTWAIGIRLVFLGASFGFVWSLISLLRGVHSS
jgi:hypothetical protein